MGPETHFFHVKYVLGRLLALEEIIWFLMSQHKYRQSSSKAHDSK